MITQIAMSVEPVEAGGKWWVAVTVGGHQLKRHGPFKSADVAKSKADQVIKYWSNHATDPPADDGVIVLNGVATKLDSTEGRRFVTDATRAAEGLLEDKILQEIYKISPAELKNIAENKALAAAIRDEGRARVRSGQRAREAAQTAFVKSPGVLDSIMSDTKASARHRIEAAKEIRQVAIGGDGAESPASSAERFVITFHLGADVERIEKTITPKPKQIEGELDASE